MRKWKKLGIPSIVAVTMIGTATTGSMTVSANSDDPYESQQEINVTEEESSEVEVKAPNKAPEHLEIVKTIEEPTDEEKGSITVANATKVKEMLRALAATDGSEQTYEVTGEDSQVKEGESELATDDQFVVTAEDGTQATYTIFVEESKSSEVEVHAPNKAPKHLKKITKIEEPTDEEKGSITVANAVTVDGMLGALAATDGSEQTHEVTGEDGQAKEGESELATDDQFVVTAEDGTQANYTIIEEESNEVEVKAPNKAPEHLEIVKTIEEPTDDEKGSITVANATKVKEMLRALTATDGSEQTYEVTSEDGKVKGMGNELATDDQFVVTAEDGTQATYTIIEAESNEVEVKAPNKAPEHLEIVKTIEEPTDEEKGSITVANATTVKEMLRALAATDGSEQIYEVTSEDGKVKGMGNELATDDQFVVTAEDGTQAIYTIIEKPAQ
ncbi:hypothetical protein [Oceanobacillus rekensis]|uniref:hypothetical protein n=1 Tax=Oceanobacillus rekensis TaxID=937927 RepID=UPI000B453D71|nr:hypothetical protein [Oceanobacillus rekensis]